MAGKFFVSYGSLFLVVAILVIEIAFAGVLSNTEIDRNGWFIERSRDSFCDTKLTDQKMTGTAD